MPRGRPISRDTILANAEAIVRADGIAACTFEAIARRLGVTKQAVIYWFPTKEELFRELVLAAVGAEAAATVAALDGAAGWRDAVARFVRALTAHHLADLGRFRTSYLAVQVSPKALVMMPQNAIMDHVHPVTARMYGALAAALAADPSFPATLDARRTAMVVHTSALGLLTMLSLADAIDDPLAHPTEALVDTLVALLARG